MTKVSAVIITLNSAETLPDTLASLTWTDEIVVVDSGSTDETLAIAQKACCRIEYKKFEGYGAQKHYAVSIARNDWVFVVDADEVCTPELEREINSELTQNIYTAFEIPISLVFLGKVLRFGGEYKKPHLRLFDKSKGQYNFARVHEDVEMREGKTKRLQQHMLHNSYSSIHHYFNKFNQYTTAAARDMKDAGKTSSFLFPFVKGILNFVKLYIFRGLILDGGPGLVWSVFSSWYTIVKYIKLASISKKS